MGVAVVVVVVVVVVAVVAVVVVVVVAIAIAIAMAIVMVIVIVKVMVAAATATGPEAGLATASVEACSTPVVLVQVVAVLVYPGVAMTNTKVSLIDFADLIFEERGPNSTVSCTGVASDLGFGATSSYFDTDFLAFGWMCLARIEFGTLALRLPVVTIGWI